MIQLGKVFVHSYSQWLDSITNSMGTNLSNLQEIVQHGEPGMLQSMGLQRVGHNLATEQQLIQPILFTDCWKPYVAAAKQNPQLSAPCKNNLEKVMWHIPSYIWAVKALLGFPGGTVVKNPPTNAGDGVRSLGWEDSLEEEMATGSSILA